MKEAFKEQQALANRISRSKSRRPFENSTPKPTLAIKEQQKSLAPAISLRASGNQSVQQMSRMMPELIYH
jgi:hypothetical protein